jgi:hypothetical protein
MVDAIDSEAEGDGEHVVEGASASVDLRVDIRRAVHIVVGQMADLECRRSSGGREACNAARNARLSPAQLQLAPSSQTPPPMHTLMLLLLWPLR